MKKVIKTLIVIFILIVLLKIVLSSFVLAPSAYSDSYVYSKMARSFYYNPLDIYSNLNVHGYPKYVMPFYSIILSLSFVFKDMIFVYFFMKVINAIISSLITFPVFLISKEFFDKKKSVIIALLIALLPSSFSFAPYIMAENLFYPLFLFAFYFLYKSFYDKGYKYDILAGLFIGLAFLTKVSALILLIVGFFMLIYKFIKDKKVNKLQINKKLVLLFIVLIFVGAWLLRNWLVLTSLTGHGIFGVYGIEAFNITKANFFVSYITWFLLYIGVVAITSLFLLFIGIFSFKNKKNTFFSLMVYLTVLFTILFISYRTAGSDAIFNILYSVSGKLTSRYIDFVLPLVFIVGFLGLGNYKKIKKVNLILISILMLFTSQIIYFTLLPINNISLSHLGLLEYLLSSMVTNNYILLLIFAVLFLIVTFLMFKFYEKVNLKRVLIYIFAFFILLNILSYSLNYYNANTFWYKSSHMQLGLWFNKYDPGISNVLIDEVDKCPLFKLKQDCLYERYGTDIATIFGFWLNDNIEIGHVSKRKGVDYIFSKQILNLRVVREYGKIFVYKVT